jgi:lysophospholipase L1-like esterase
MGRMPLSDAQLNDQYLQVQRTTLTQGWADVHGVHFTGTQPGLSAGDRWSIMSNVNSDEVRNLGAMQAIADRDRAADLRRRLRALTGQVPQPAHILAVGDSITRGAGSVDGLGYRPWLQDLLDQRDINASITLAGFDGATLDAVVPAVTAALAAEDFDIALLAIGTNDSAWSSLTTFQSRYAALVDQILTDSPGVKVACAKISISHARADPVRANPAVTANQQQINTWIGQVVAARPRTTVADMSVIPPEWLHDGGWHPGNAGYARMAQIWVDAITPWLP